MNNTDSSNTNFQAKILRNSVLIYDLRATIEGEARYFIVKIQPLKKELFLREVEKDAGFRLEDFGEVLHRGWGEPSSDSKRQLYEKYGIYAEEFVADPTPKSEN